MTNLVFPAKYSNKTNNLNKLRAVMRCPKELELSYLKPQIRSPVTTGSCPTYLVHCCQTTTNCCPESK